MRLTFISKGSSCGVSQNKGCSPSAPPMLRLLPYLYYNSDSNLYTRSQQFMNEGGLEREGLELGDQLVGQQQGSTRHQQGHSQTVPVSPRDTTAYQIEAQEEPALSQVTSQNPTNLDLSISFFQQTFLMPGSIIRHYREYKCN